MTPSETKPLETDADVEETLASAEQTVQPVKAKSPDDMEEPSQNTKDTVRKGTFDVRTWMHGFDAE